MREAEYYISKLNLKRHPEGGHFNEVYRSGDLIGQHDLPQRYNGDRSFATSIYFLLHEDNFSAFHKLQSDELWTFFDGSTVLIYIIDDEGKLTEKKLGKDIENGEEMQLVVPNNRWFASELQDKRSFALAGCISSPGFEYDDFELGKCDSLVRLYPQHQELIKRLTRQ